IAAARTRNLIAMELLSSGLGRTRNARQVFGDHAPVLVLARSLVEDELSLPRDLEAVHRALMLDADLMRAAEERFARHHPRHAVERTRRRHMAAVGNGGAAEGVVIHGSIAVHDTVPFRCPGS